ncbi:MAG: radical SAM protein, partial [Lachnospiraceae bacterium]|nr:radical SAM protein [Lachnospiraceae bacterium]
IVRHLLLPGHKKNAKKIISYVYKTYRDNVFISLMNQYTPFDRVKGNPEFGSLCRKVTKREYEDVVDYAIGLGVRNAFIQEDGAAEESFIPSFDGEGVD